MAKRRHVSQKDVDTALRTYMRRTRLDLTIARFRFLDRMRRVSCPHVVRCKGGYRGRQGEFTISSAWEELTSCEAQVVRGVVNTLAVVETKGAWCGDHRDDLLQVIMAELNVDRCAALDAPLAALRSEARRRARRAAKRLFDGELLDCPPPDPPDYRPRWSIVQWLEEWAPPHCTYLNALDKAAWQTSRRAAPKGRRGRPPAPKEEQKADRNLLKDWKKGCHKTYADLARSLGMTPREVKLAIDRARKRAERAAKRRADK